MIKLRLFKPGQPYFQTTVGGDHKASKIAEDIRTALKSDPTDWVWYAGDTESGQHVLIPAQVLRTHVIVVEDGDAR